MSEKLTVKQYHLQICRDEKHEIETYTKNGKEYSFCVQCEDLTNDNLKQKAFRNSLKRLQINNHN